MIDVVESREKDQKIIWQNQSHLALEFLKSKDKPVSLLELCLVTDALTEWCMFGKTKNVKDKLIEIDNFYKNGTQKG